MMRSSCGWARAGMTAGALLLTAGTAWGQTFVYPHRGQSPQQQAQDQAECQAWATQQTGTNPGMAAAMPAPGAPPQSSLLR